uniref:Secreted protein n=1 Tax=Ixodes ricinus TaxID=34613 RepID=A0A0K8R422_IXORI
MSVCTFLSSLVCLTYPPLTSVCVNKTEDIVTKMHCQFSHFKLIVQLSFWQDASSRCASIQTKCEPAANSSHSAGDQLQLTSLTSKSLCASIKPYLNLFILVAFAHFCLHLLQSRNSLKLL